MLCNFTSLAQADDAGNVQRARTHASLMATAIDNSGELHARIAATDVEGADALRSVNLVAADGQQVDVVLLDVDRNLANRLNAVHGEEDSALFGDLSDLGDRIDHPNL